MAAYMKDRTSCRCLVRRSKCSGLQIKYREWRQMKMLFLVLVKKMDIGTRSPVCCGAFGPSGLNLNNDNDIANDNNGLAVGLPSGNPVYIPY